MTLFKRKNGYYYIKLTRQGKVSWVTTKCRTKGAALQALQSYRKEDTEPRTLAVNFDQFRRQILTYTASNYSRRSHEIYELALRRLEEHLTGRAIDQMTPRLAEEYKLWRLRSAKPVTVNIEIRTLRSAFNLATRWGIVGHNPFGKVAQIRIADRPPVFLTREQYAALLAGMDGAWVRDIVIFAVCTGMRQGEILHLERRHVDQRRRVVHVTSTSTFKTKTGRRRVVPLNDPALDVVRRQPDGQPFVFTYDGRPVRRDSLTHAFKRSVRASGLPDEIHFHSLRHTFASWLVQDGVSLFQVGRLLGHTDTKTTEIYAHLQPETMHDVVDRLKMT